MLSVTRFVLKTTRSFRPLLINSTHGSSVNIKRCIYACKSVHKYRNNISQHNVSFSTSVRTEAFGEGEASCNNSNSSSDTKDEPNQVNRDGDNSDRYMLVEGIPYTFGEKEVMDFFPDVEMVKKPHIIELSKDRSTGSVILQVRDIKSVRLCLEKHGSNFSGRFIHVKEIDINKANAYLGKTILKVTNFSFCWGKTELLKYLKNGPLKNYVKKIINVYVPVSPFGNVSSGRAYLEFCDMETKEAAKECLEGAKVPWPRHSRTLRLFDSNLDKVQIDLYTQKRKLSKNTKDPEESYD